MPFTRLRALSWAERALLAEALVALAFAALAVAVLPFRLIDRLAAGSPSSRSPQDRHLTICKVAWAVRAAARRVPFRAKCFEQGLAASRMLHRRGVDTTVHYGAAREQDGLIAHVWVTAGADEVVGCENRDRFIELTRLGRARGVAPSMD